MTELWFEEGISHRNTGRAEWLDLPERKKMAIVLAANATAGTWLQADVWELLTAECRERWLAEADRLISGGTSVAARASMTRVAVSEAA